MTNALDASIKMLHAVDAGSDFTIDTVKLDDPFDVIANVEIGERLMDVVDQHDLFVSVRNLSQSKHVMHKDFSEPLTPQAGALNREVRVKLLGGWKKEAREGDLLEVVATYKVTAGRLDDYSSQRSAPFIVSVGP
jgi:hypothetical protein